MCKPELKRRGPRQIAALAVALCAAAPQLALASRIWYEQGLATVTVGYDLRTSQYTYRKFYAVAYGPDSFPGVAHDAARKCTRAVTAHVGEDMRVDLWKIKTTAPSGGSTSADKDERNKSGGERDAAVDALVNVGIQSFRQRLQSCSSGRFDASQFQLALIQRVCDSRTHSCANTPKSISGHPAAEAFNSLSLWIDARNGKHPTLPANTPVLLPDLVNASTTLKQLDVKTSTEALEKCKQQVDAVASSATARRPLTCLALEMASREYKESNLWPDTPPRAVAQAELERLAVHARHQNKRVDKNAARLADAPFEVATRFVDVLDEPQEALLDLKHEADAKLLAVQDELARSRIAECVRFRGQVAPAEVAACAGYSVDASTINQCLSGAACLPKLGEKGWAGVLANLETGTMKDVALSSLSPRTSAQLEQLESTAKDCAKKGSHQAAATCALERQLGEKERKAWACVKGKAARQLDAKTVECAVGAALPPEAKAAIECTKKFKSSADQAQCAIVGTLPPVAGKLLECQSKFKDDTSRAGQCMAAAAGGDVGKAAACIRQSERDWAKATTCFAGDKVPKSVSDVIECAQKSSGAAATGGCLALKNVPEQYRKPAQCIAESGGDPFGAGVCMASDGLNPDQRIALQCLASTGGEPVSFATCTSGRLFVKEMFNCVDKKLFEDKCMGEGNEIRKFMKALGVDLKPSTVVGQVLNAPLDVIKFQVAAAQAALKGLDDLSKNLPRELNRAAEDIGREVGKGVQNVGREAGRVSNQAKTDANNGLEWAEKRTGIRLPRF